MKNLLQFLGFLFLCFATILANQAHSAMVTCPTGSTATGSGYATTGTGQFRDKVFWLDWSCGATTQFNPSDIIQKTWTGPNGIEITATLSGIITTPLSGSNVGTFPTTLLDDLYGGVNPIRLQGAIKGNAGQYDLAFTTTLNGVPIPTDLVIADAENTDLGEFLNLETDGDSWQLIEVAPSSSLTLTPQNGGQGLLVQDTDPTFPPGTFLALSENMSSVRAIYHSGGLQGIAYGIMLPFDHGDASGFAASGGHLARQTASGSDISALAVATFTPETPYLGAIAPDTESADQPTASADGDDTTDTDDEDGVASFPVLTDTDSSYSLTGITVETTGTNATLLGWIDLDMSGTFDEDERASVAITAGATTADLTWSSLPGITSGNTFVRLRIARDGDLTAGSDGGGDEAAVDAVASGEMEDYAVTIAVGGVSVSGVVHEDTQPNAKLDSGETGTGEALFVKLLSRTGTTCNAPALQAVAANPATGAFTLSSVSDGDYCLIVDTNNTLTDTTPNPATGWLVTSPSGGQRHLSVAGQNVPNQHFGLYHGSQLSGTVFQDTGNPSGTANDGMQNGAETGIDNVTVTITDCASTVHDTATTNANGTYSLQIPGAIATGANLCVIQTNAASSISTGASVGDTSGSYNRTSDTIQFTYTSGTSYSGVDFGDVPPNQWLTDGHQSGLPGTVLWYPHIFTAGSAGTVTFSIAASPSPAVSGWSETLYEDSNCNGVIDSGEGQISSMALNAGQQVCVLLREAIPSAVSDGSAQHVTVTASFDYSNAAPPLSDVQTRSDVTTVGEGEAAGLHLHKAVDKAQALPGEVITYTITYSNRNAQPVSNIVIHDKTPAFTLFQSAVCDTPLPASLSDCSVTQQPAVNGTGAIEWTLTGTLGSGHGGTVTFSVKIQN